MDLDPDQIPDCDLDHDPDNFTICHDMDHLPAASSPDFVSHVRFR